MGTLHITEFNDSLSVVRFHPPRRRVEKCDTRIHGAIMRRNARLDGERNDTRGSLLESFREIAFSSFAGQRADFADEARSQAGRGPLGVLPTSSRGIASTRHSRYRINRNPLFLFRTRIHYKIVSRAEFQKPGPRRSGISSLSRRAANSIRPFSAGAFKKSDTEGKAGCINLSS